MNPGEKVPICFCRFSLAALKNGDGDYSTLTFAGITAPQVPANGETASISARWAYETFWPTDRRQVCPAAGIVGEGFFQRHKRFREVGHPANHYILGWVESSAYAVNAIKPTSAAWKKLHSAIINGYDPGHAGAQMLLRDLTLTPKSVNFERIEVQETSGPASNINGYFANNPPFSNHGPILFPLPAPAGALWHRADNATGEGNGIWMSINSFNRTPINYTDKAGVDPPVGVHPNLVPGGYTNGGFTWEINMNYRSVDNPGGQGIHFTTINQIFSLQQDGTMSVTKDDADICKVSRTP